MIISKVYNVKFRDTKQLATTSQIKHFSTFSFLVYDVATHHVMSGKLKKQASHG